MRAFGQNRRGPLNILQPVRSLMNQAVETWAASVGGTLSRGVRDLTWPNASFAALSENSPAWFKDFD